MLNKKERSTMYNETKRNKYAQLQTDLELQTEALSKKLEETKVKRKYRLQKEFESQFESQTEAFDKILKEITLLNHHLENIETSLCSMQKPIPTPRNPLNILDKFDFDVDKLLDTLEILFDLYKEDIQVNKNEDGTEEKEVLKGILKGIINLKNKTNMNTLSQLGQAFQNPLNILKNVDFEKTFSILSLFYHLYKENKIEDESEDLDKGIS
jgi:hypothetical protein